MKIKNLIIVLLIIIIIVLLGLLINNKLNENNKSIEQNNSLIGKYVITYSDIAPIDIKNNLPSELILNHDNTFNFRYNNCDDFYIITGEFKINGEKLVLSNLSKPINNYNTISFNIVSNNELYLNNFIGCVINYNEYQKGYGSFKKID